MNEQHDPVTTTVAATIRRPRSDREKKRREQRRVRIAACAVIAVVSGGVGAGLESTIRPVTGSAPAAEQAIRASVPTPTNLVGLVSAVQTPLSGGDRTDVSDLITSALPSVVDISVVLIGGTATGSGFVISSDGRIVTNAHVVADASKITVTFSDHQSVPATVLGVDRTEDLAVIHVDRTGLQALPLGSSADLKMGRPVVAIGSALALTGGPSATEGIVSALNRSIDTADGEHLAHLLQTDAAINPGNSGGPLLALDGKVVGINSAGSTDAQNIGFAIAIDTAKPIIDQLQKGQSVTRGFLGVSTMPIDQSVVAQYGLGVSHGLLVADVTAGSAADQAGLKVGDVIVSANGNATDEAGALSDAISQTGVGQRLTLQVRRDGSIRKLAAVLGSHAA